MASRFSAQMSGQMPGWPAAIRVMSRNPPAASRSRPRCSSDRSSASRISLAAVRWGTWDTTATIESWRSGGIDTTAAPSRLTTDRMVANAVVVGAGHRRQHPGGALEQIGPGSVDPLQLGAGHRMATDVAGVVHELEHRRLHAADVGDQARGGGERSATCAAMAPTGVATKRQLGVGIVPHRVEGPELEGPVGTGGVPVASGHVPALAPAARGRSSRR